MQSTKLLLIALLAVAPPAIHAESPVAGPWHGDIQAGATTLTLEIQIRHDARGRLVGTVESIDQAPGQLIPISDIEVKGDQLVMLVAPLQARYTAQFEAEGNGGRWIGTWKQGSEAALTLAQGPAPVAPVVSGLDGTWRALLERNTQKLRLVLKIDTGVRGTRAQMDSPDAGLAGMAVANLEAGSGSVQFEVPIAEVTFTGRIDAVSGSVKGTWLRKGMAPAPVEFRRDAIKPAQASLRPQTPLPPLPYLVESVTLAGLSDGLSLSGTLTRPDVKGRVPAVLLIGGSGPQDRDHTMYGHRPFAVLADQLTRQGFAVLRMDDRGVGQSTGYFAAATTSDFVADALVALQALSKRNQIDPQRIGIIGHSEGAVVAALAAKQSSIPRFAVLLASPGIPMPQLMADQFHATTTSGSGLSSTRSAVLVRHLYDEARLAGSDAEARARIAPLLTDANLRLLGVGQNVRAQLVAQFSSAWMRELLQYDAPTVLKSLRIPVLALHGSHDRQVEPKANLRAIADAIRAQPGSVAEELAGLNHMFQHSSTGHPAEYPQLDESFSPVAMARIGSWIGRISPQ